ncbi:MAG: hypothetical protein QGF67_03230 [Lentisphaeria bacterium]|nr:hypothetical protein [Lentisphaeria bacterium]MDP7740425.1 hypothetical protein [Lentisphaeria bacterium]
MSFSAGISSCTSEIDDIPDSTGDADSNAEKLVTKPVVETPTASML